MGADSIRNIVVAGGGITGWSAAAAIRRRLPAVSVTVVPMPPPPDALADRVACTLPSVVDFHHDIGLTEADTVVRAGSGFRMGTRFVGWAEGRPDYVHAYGDCGVSLGGAAFHQHWLRTAEQGAAAPFDSFSAAAAMAREDRFAMAGAAGDGSERFAYGLYIDPSLYREMMRAYALHLGAAEQAGDVAGVRLSSETGFIDAVKLAGGAELSGDLFIDATGPRVLLRKSVGGEWDDWSRYLIVDRVICGEAAAAAPHLLDTSTAIPGGWIWQASAPAGTSVGICYSSRHLDDSAAARHLAEAGAERVSDPTAIGQGRWAEPWARNCVAIGDSAALVEPLEWTNLHLAHSAIDRIIEMLPGRDCSPVEIAEYNRQESAELDRVLDFLVAHYVLARRPADPFWDEASSVELPPTLAHTLAQFQERGRLPFHEEETFSRDSWLALLLGQGVVPRRVDPLVDSVPPEHAAHAMANVRQRVGRFVDSLPTHVQVLEILRQKVA